MKKPSPPPVIVWFRRDLRLRDQPALLAACETGAPVLPLFIWAPDEEGAWAPGAAARWWLHHSLEALDAALRKKGSRLLIRVGASGAILRHLAEETGANTVHACRVHDPLPAARDQAVATELASQGVALVLHGSGLLFEPGEIRNKQGLPFKVFTPFWRTCLEQADPLPPQPAPRHVPAPTSWPKSLTPSHLKLLPDIDWAAGFRKARTPGEETAQALWKQFLSSPVDRYATARDLPGQPGTSRLSPHLHWGEMGARQIWHDLQRREPLTASGRVFLSQIGWREFAHQLLHHFPHTVDQPLQPLFARFPWRENKALLKAWQQGRTGYPIVDAGLRELWATGWMHNRVRMIVASFLVKDLMQPWQAGARWFWDTLVDADLANNTLGWQWAAGCGADAAPYFRIFNPTSQARKFDPEGAYIRRWSAPGAPPPPLVDHADAREEALAAYHHMRHASQ